MNARFPNNFIYTGTGNNRDSTQMKPDNETVEIDSGRLRGVRRNGAVCFKGIPYAAPTAAGNRFMAPRAVVPWSGVREANHYGDRCPQERESYADTPAFSWYGQTEQFSENCCVLNVFTPDLRAGDKRPVMVYIHGGGYITGGSGGPILDGSNLAEFGDVVVVTVNHRLNVFGCFHLGHIDDRFCDATNVGQLDLIAALHWIRRNISTFGGDPANVTLFGQSGGGSKIMVLMGMPAAKGLFHRAINMSGAAGLTVPDAANADPFVAELLKSCEVDAKDLHKLQALAPEVLLGARGAARATTRVDWSRPLIDGRHVVAEAMSPQGLELHSSVPMMIGSTLTEATFYFCTDPRNFKVTEEQVRRRICAQFGVGNAAAHALMAAYRENCPARTAADILIALATDTQFRVPLLRAAETKAQAGKAPVYVYNFVWPAPVEGGTYRSPHTIDIPFAFGNTGKSASLTGSGAEVAEVSRNLMSAFVAFARSGNPNNARMPEWPAYSAGKRATMTIDAKCQVIPDFLRGDRVASWDLQLDRFHRPLFNYQD